MKKSYCSSKVFTPAHHNEFFLSKWVLSNEFSNMHKNENIFQPKLFYFSLQNCAFSYLRKLNWITFPFSACNSDCGWWKVIISQNYGEFWILECKSFCLGMLSFISQWSWLMSFTLINFIFVFFHYNVLGTHRQNVISGIRFSGWYLLTQY